ATAGNQHGDASSRGRYAYDRRQRERLLRFGRRVNRTDVHDRVAGLVGNALIGESGQTKHDQRNPDHCDGSHVTPPLYRRSPRWRGGTILLSEHETCQATAADAAEPESERGKPSRALMGLRLSAV